LKLYLTKKLVAQLRINDFQVSIHFRANSRDWIFHVSRNKT